MKFICAKYFLLSYIGWFCNFFFFFFLQARGKNVFVFGQPDRMGWSRWPNKRRLGKASPLKKTELFENKFIRWWPRKFEIYFRGHEGGRGGSKAHRWISKNPSDLLGLGFPYKFIQDFIFFDRYVQIHLCEKSISAHSSIDLLLHLSTFPCVSSHYLPDAMVVYFYNIDSYWFHHPTIKAKMSKPLYVKEMTASCKLRHRWWGYCLIMR